MQREAVIGEETIAWLRAMGIGETALGTSTGKDWWGSGATHKAYSPVDAQVLGAVSWTTAEEYARVMARARTAFLDWRSRPAPARGEMVRQIGEALRKHKQPLGTLVSYEMGKSLEEGLGEVQEMIDICDYAVGLSRQLHGLTMHSERPSHRMYEQYHPLGVVGVLSAFNFPVAVWSWNSMIAWVCGNVCVWKPSEKTPFSALACQRMVGEVLASHGVPEGVSNLVLGDAKIGNMLVEDKGVSLVSATGSVRMGRQVAAKVGQRLGRVLLELGGNNAMVVSPHGRMDLALRAVLFGAVGTAGQRCTTTRRLIVHSSIFEAFTKRLIAAYAQIRIGHPLSSENHMGPLIDKDAVKTYLAALVRIAEQGGRVLMEGGMLEGEGYESGCYVRPALYEMRREMPILQEETFAPILYVLRYESFEEAIAIQNEVSQGLSSALISDNLQEVEYFLSHGGSDCGIANVNMGTSGAEIGGAFGGEKDTGGGRESGSDSWKAYMRRQTNSINYGNTLPLAQGIHFEVDRG